MPAYTLIYMIFENFPFEMGEGQMGRSAYARRGFLVSVRVSRRGEGLRFSPFWGVRTD